MRERSQRTGRLYAAIPNEAMRDSEISMEARGLLALLMTYSDDWDFRKEHLMGVTKWGRDKFERHMGELIEAGYVERVLTREEGTGKLLGSSWIIRDSRGPENQGVGDTEALKNRPPVKPTPGKSAPIRNNKREEEQQEEDLFGSDEPHRSRDDASQQDRFNEFWKVYPKKSGKPKAVKAWENAIKRHDPEKIIAAAKVYAKAVEGADPKYTKHPQGWLNDERFNDPENQPKPADDGSIWAKDWRAFPMVR